MKGPRVGNDETCKIIRFATHFWIAIDQRSEERNFNFCDVFSSRIFSIRPIRSSKNHRVRVCIVLIEIKIHEANNDDNSRCHDRELPLSLSSLSSLSFPSLLSAAARISRAKSSRTYLGELSRSSDPIRSLLFAEIFFYRLASVSDLICSF